MSEVFADTAYFIAHLNRADQYHRPAVDLSDRLGARVITSDWVVLEVADGFRHDALSPAGSTLGDTLAQFVCQRSCEGLGVHAR
jgi:predicted nucleic acid-binding protein